jgi:NAD(P)H-dependent flavin oxidoreductase YrpB (nitropropane dioxygenase family)
VIFAGAGISRDIYAWGKEGNVPIVPIVSTAKLAKIVEKLGASAVVVEGKEAGGHLGTDRSVKEIVPEVKASVSIPVFAAGGIIDGKDIVEALKYGADGVQMATRFVASEECNASDAFKQMYLNARKEDIVIIDSPVGFKGRAIRNTFTERIKGDSKIPPQKCDHCLKDCSKKFCILKALRNSQEGNVEEGLVFSGENVCRVNDILPVRDIISRLVSEVNSYTENK